MKARVRTLSFLIAAATALAGCGDDSTEPADDVAQAPALPPAESMQFDFSFFDQNPGPGGELNGVQAAGRIMSRDNWINAALRVALIDVAVNLALAPPRLAFLAALSEEPELQPDGSFLWVYTWTNQAEEAFEIRLRGRIEGDHVAWRLAVRSLDAGSEADPLVWFWGESNFANNSGFWIFHDLETREEVEAARIDWSIPAEDQRLAVFENIHEGHEGFGDTLSYSEEGAIVLVQFYDASEDLNAEITWDKVTRAGSLMVPGYNEGERACWDEYLDDLDCAIPAM